jgi:hypothetical protein
LITQTGGATAAGLEEGAKRYTENLKKLGCERIPEAQELNRQFNDYQNLDSELEHLLETSTALKPFRLQLPRTLATKETLPNWDTDISAAPVHQQI